MPTSFYKIGHRGAAGYSKENTLDSFQKALSLGANMIELDVHRCQSGEVVVAHDKDIERLTSQKGLIKEKGLTELKQLGFFSLAQVLEHLPFHTNINIELKERETAEPVAELLRYHLKIGKFQFDNFLISSFDFSAIKKFKTLMPQIKVGLLISRNPFSCLIKIFPFVIDFYIRRARKIKAFSLHLDKKLVRPNIIKKIHQNNLRIFVYTVNQSEEIKQLKQWGVDGIFSDYPDRL